MVCLIFCIPRQNWLIPTTGFLGLKHLTTQHRFGKNTSLLIQLKQSSILIGAADFDADGKMDIIIAEMQQGADPDEVAIFYHERKNTWQKQVISTGGSHSMRVLDLDGDGDMDVFGANFAENVVKLWINERKK